VYHEDMLRVMQEKKTEDMMRESRRKDKAASTITRCIRLYGQMIRKGMGFTIRRQGLAWGLGGFEVLGFWDFCGVLIFPRC
jgi:hypothetical protein